LFIVKKKEYFEAYDSDEKIIVENFVCSRKEKDLLIFKKAELLDLAHSFSVRMKKILLISHQRSEFSKLVKKEDSEKNEKN
jgi:hypothetical protein